MYLCPVRALGGWGGACAQCHSCASSAPLVFWPLCGCSAVGIGGGGGTCQRVPEDGSRLAVMEAAYICMMICTQRRLDRQKGADLAGDPPSRPPERRARREGLNQWRYRLDLDDQVPPYEEL